MTVMLLFCVVLFAAVFVLVYIALRSQRKQNAMKHFSWRRLRYVFTILVVLGAAAIAFQPVTAHASQTSPPDITYVLCGSEAQMPYNTDPQTGLPDPNSNQWTYVLAPEIAHQPDGSPITATGYTGPHHDINHPDGVNCLGDYYYGWDQYYHKATWTWSVDTSIASPLFPNLHSQLKDCRALVYIPTWYAGAPQARYSIDIQPPISKLPGTFKLDQNNAVQDNIVKDPALQRWVLLDFLGDGQSYIQLGGTSSKYTFMVTLQNGGGLDANGQFHWWYLAADAMKFECHYAPGLQA